MWFVSNSFYCPKVVYVHAQVITISYSVWPTHHMVFWEKYPLTQCAVCYSTSWQFLATICSVSQCTLMHYNLLISSTSNVPSVVVTQDVREYKSARHIIINRNVIIRLSKIFAAIRSHTEGAAATVIWTEQESLYIDETHTTTNTVLTVIKFTGNLILLTQVLIDTLQWIHQVKPCM